MDIKNYILTRKNKFILILIFFLLLIVTLVLRKTIPYLLPFSLIFIFLFILFSQFFDFDNRIYILCALLLLICCPFLLIYNQKLIAENFANYAFAFLCLGVLGFFLDSFRKKAKKDRKTKNYKISITVIMLVIILATAFYYFGDIFIFFRKTELFFLKKINIQTYYVQEHKNFKYMLVDGKFVNSKLKMDITFPDNSNKKITFANIFIEGWAIDENSKENEGIGSVELWLDGKPGYGIFLGNANLGLINNNIANIFGVKFENSGFSGNFKLEKIKSGSHDVYIYAQSQDSLFGWIYKKININIKNYSDSDKIKEAELLNKDIKIFIDEPTKQKIVQDSFEVSGWALDTNAMLNPGIDSVEIWLDGLPGEGKLLAEGTLNKDRADVAQYIGQSQYIKSGYLFKLSGDAIKKGNHVIFVFVHSVYSGWAYSSVNFEMK